MPPKGNSTALEPLDRNLALKRRDVETALRLPPRRHRRHSRSGRWRRRWAELAREGELSRRFLLAAPLIAIGFAIWAFGGVYGWAFGLAYLLVFSAVAVWALLAGLGRSPAQWRPVYAPMLAFGGLVGAQYALGFSVVPASTSTAMLHLSAAGGVFLLVSQLYRAERDARWLTAAFSVFTATLALLAILQNLTGSNGIYWTFTYAFASPAGSFVNKNNFAGCMEMLLPVACVQAYWHRHDSWLYALPWAAPPALGVAAVVLSASRGGAASLMVEMLAGLVVLWRVEHRAASTLELPGWLPWPDAPPAARKPHAERRHRHQGHQHRRPLRGRRHGDPWRIAKLLGRRGSRWATLAGAVALTVALVLSVGTQRLDRRLSAANPNTPSFEQRDLLNLSSWTMFTERPLVGWGLGTWPDIYPAFSRFTDASVFQFAHNDYLQLLAETGLAGVGCTVLFWWVWGVEFRRRFRQWPAGRGRPPAAPVAVAAAIACLGILVHSWVDFNLHIPANLMLFFALAALAIPPRLASL